MMLMIMVMMVLIHNDHGEGDNGHDNEDVDARIEFVSICDVLIFQKHGTYAWGSLDLTGQVHRQYQSAIYSFTPPGRFLIN